MKSTAVRLVVLDFALAGVVWFKFNFNPYQPIMLIPWGMLTAGITYYGGWAIWCMWKPRLDMLRRKE